MDELPVGDPLEVTKLEDGIGMCMSGGGFRAMLFHLGSLWRLNEMGMLPRIARFSSVSGGSIANAVLAHSWTRLDFPSSATSPHFPQLVAKPILALARQCIDIPAILIGLLPFQSSGKRVAAAYRRALFGDASLQSLPEEPRFIFNAVNLMSTSLVRFSPSYVADYRVGEIKLPNLSLADVVAASSAFPPMLSPFVMDFGAQPMIPFENSTLGRSPYTQRAVLADGGIYDNLGLETIWKRYRTIIASNASRNVAAQERPWHSWPFQLNRVVNIIYNQVENGRERQLLALAQTKQRTVAYWTIETKPESGADCPLSLSSEECAKSSAISTRLTSLSAEECTLLVKHGYLLADLTVRRYIDVALPPAQTFPDLRDLY